MSNSALYIWIAYDKKDTENNLVEKKHFNNITVGLRTNDVIVIHYKITR